MSNLIEIVEREVLQDVKRYEIHGAMPYRILASKYGKRLGAARLKALMESLELQGLIQIGIEPSGRTMITLKAA